MAVVPDRRQQYEHKLETLKTNRRIVLETLQKVCNFCEYIVEEIISIASSFEIPHLKKFIILFSDNLTII